jgi:hypothetical protein
VPPPTIAPFFKNWTLPSVLLPSIDFITTMVTSSYTTCHHLRSWNTSAWQSARVSPSYLPVRLPGKSQHLWQGFSSSHVFGPSRAVQRFVFGKRLALR